MPAQTMIEAAAAEAQQRVAAVSNDPQGRLQLLQEFYTDPAALEVEDYGRAEVAFMEWEVQRGVLNPVHAEHPGSPWWRAVNERIIRDAEEARLLHDGAVVRGGSNPAVDRWLTFLRNPTAVTWYRAHNCSVVWGYLEAPVLARGEIHDEQRFMNLVLERVLYAEALVEDELLALGPFAAIGRFLADPRASGIQIIMSVPAFYPRHYPLDRMDELRLDDLLPTVEDQLAGLINADLVLPQLDQLYVFAARILDIPRLNELVQGGVACYPDALIAGSARTARIRPAQKAASFVLDELRRLADRVGHEIDLRDDGHAIEPVLRATSDTVMGQTLAMQRDAYYDALVADITMPPGLSRLGWVAGQTWEKVLFLNWRVPAAVLKPLIPHGLDLDTFENQAWVSLLPLRMNHVHLHGLPPLPELTDFPELNFRTYVVKDGHPGVYFFSLDAPSRLLALLGQYVFHLNYFPATMSMSRGDSVTFTSVRDNANASFSVRYTGFGPAHEAAAGSLENWLTDRMAMYAVDGTRLVRGDIHHPPWELRVVRYSIDVDTVPAAAGVLNLAAPDLVLYSDAVKNVVYPMRTA